MPDPLPSPSPEDPVGRALHKLVEARDLEMRAPSRYDFEAYGLNDYIALVDEARTALEASGPLSSPDKPEGQPFEEELVKLLHERTDVCVGADECEARRLIHAAKLRSGGGSW